MNTATSPDPVDLLKAELAAAPLSRRYSDDELEAVYALAYSQIQQNHHAAALPLFAFLTQYAPTNLHYLMGLGMCFQKLGEFEAAVQVYSFIGVLDEEAFDASLHVAECLLFLQQTSSATALLTLLVQQAKDVGAETIVSTRAAALLDLLGKKQEGASLER